MDTVERIGSIMQSDTLSMLLKMQKELMNHIKHRVGDEDMTLTNITNALFVEVAEWANAHEEFKYWKLAKHYDREKVLEEFVDILFFWLQAMIMQRFTVFDIVKKYVEKWEVNMERQDNGY